MFSLQGRQVTLTTTVAADGPALCRIRATPEVLLRWPSEDLVAEFDEDLEDDDTVRLTIRFEHEVVGLIQFGEEDEPDYRHASIDIYLDPAVHRRGVATDAIHTLVAYLLDERGHHRIIIDPAADNAAAIGCYAKVGFAPVGIMRQYERGADGTWHDGLLMDLVADDYPGSQGSGAPGPGASGPGA